MIDFFLSDGIPSEELWARHGLTGLVLAALFSLIVLFIAVIRRMQKDEREERAAMRKDTGELIEGMREDNREVTGKLARAIDGLSDQIRAWSNDK